MRRTGLTFDTLAPAEAAPEHVFALLFHAQRASRLVQQQARDLQMPGLDDVITRALDATWRQPAGADYDGEVRRAVDYVALSRLLTLAADAKAAPQVLAVVTRQLEIFGDWLASASARTVEPAQP
ncbi:MAG: hypothetical protein HY736_27500 [Verrucomicrobia bacterium]|nr:hypothetical protein [Verrucomicrobiota bacterium]